MNKSTIDLFIYSQEEGDLPYSLMVGSDDSKHFASIEELAGHLKTEGYGDTARYNLCIKVPESACGDNLTRDEITVLFRALGYIEEVTM